MILISRPVSRSAIYDLDLVLDLEGVGLDLDLGASDLGIFSRDQHCYYVKYHMKKLLKSFTNWQKRDSIERIHPVDTNGLRTSIFISSFNFPLGPGVYTAALEKCMHAHSWMENQAAEIQLRVGLVVLILISEISDLDLRDSDLDLELWILISILICLILVLILISDPLVLDQH